jgi:MFS family permease
MIAWGSCTVCLGVVHNYHELVVVRICLGIAEAGLYPGVAYYLTMWCKKLFGVKSSYLYITLLLIRR